MRHKIQSFTKLLARKASLENIRLMFADDMNLFDAVANGKFLSHANIHVKCLYLGCLIHLNCQNLALLAENISCKGSEVIEISAEHKSIHHQEG